MTALELLDWAVPDIAPPSQSWSPKPRRSIRRLLQPLFRHVAESRTCWRAESVGFWRQDGERYWMPRLVFTRPGEEPTIKLAIFAGIHGDEPAGVHAMCDLVRSLEAVPSLAGHYLIHLYPLCNPTGYEDCTRCSRAG